MKSNRSKNNPNASRAMKLGNHILKRKQNFGNGRSRLKATCSSKRSSRNLNSAKTSTLPRAQLTRRSATLRIASLCETENVTENDVPFKNMRKPSSISGQNGAPPDSLANENNSNSTKQPRRKKRPSIMKPTDVACTDAERHEAFVKSFAVPTHLYRYLAYRHRQRPLYLDRTLSYLRPACQASRDHPNPGKTKLKRSIYTVAERLFQEQQQKLKSNAYRATRGLETSPASLIKDIRSPPSTYWPHEVQITFEGFYDSAKELDWITVEASVGLFFRFGSSWRHKAVPGDTMVTPFSTPFPLTCYNPLSGLEHEPNVHAHKHCNFDPLELWKSAQWSTTGGRLNSGQLELRINAVERRWLKRPNSSKERNSSTPEPTYRPGSASGRKAGLGSASYPVHYMTAPLPLFYQTNMSSSPFESHPFMLTPGLYELRLGVDDDDDHHTIPVSNTNVPKQSALPNGFRDTNSTTGSSDISTVKTVDDAVYMNEAGAVSSGRIEWRRIRFPDNIDVVDNYSRWPRLKFRVTWRGRALEHKNSSFHASDIKKPLVNGTSETRLSSVRNESLSTPPRYSPKSVLTRCLTDPIKPPCPVIKSEDSTELSVLSDRPTLNAGFPKRSATRPYLRDTSCLPTRLVTYRFLFNGQLRQWSQSSDLVCPWCQLNCLRARERGPEALLVHLRTCHPRFRFKASWSSARSHLSLDVSLNEAFDGSNDCGLRRWSCDELGHHRVVPAGQLIGGWTGLGCENVSNEDTHPWTAFSSNTSRVRRPLRRLPYTHLIFWRGTDQRAALPLDPTLSVRPMVVGHNRVYYHTQTVQPVRACELEIDSEAEDAPLWLRQHYQRKVEEFSDVNLGEKQLMQLWNDLLLSIKPSDLVVCDSQITNLCFYFVRNYASAIHSRRLRNNLLLHFANLLDYGLVSPKHMRQLVSLYDELVPATQPQTPDAFAHQKSPP